jgi:SET domain-containing protein
VVRRSSIHGRGVFALCDIAAGSRLFEYGGQVISWRAAQARHNATGTEGHTFFFDRGDGTVIDGGQRGNSARYINHGCRPNCEAINEDGRIYIYAAEDIPAGAELLLDYQLQIDEPTEEDLATYSCACTTPGCRRTMLA